LIKHEAVKFSQKVLSCSDNCLFGVDMAALGFFHIERVNLLGTYAPVTEHVSTEGVGYLTQTVCRVHARRYREYFVKFLEGNALGFGYEEQDHDWRERRMSSACE
jgi:hypothetical protein